MAVFGINGLTLQAQTACIWEATARKIGNVHPAASFVGTEFTHFLVSGAALGEVFSRFGHGFQDRPGSVGKRVHLTVQSVQCCAGTNTNLGIVLLLSPLFQAAHGEVHDDLRAELSRVLDELTVSDSVEVFQAIRTASPGGIGNAPEQDVKSAPTVTLLDAMRLAADRDLIARQYANGFADVFDFGVPAFLAAWAKFGRVEPAVIACQLKWLATYPDSLIARKNGPAVADDVRRRAEQVLSLGGLDTPEGRAAGIALDRFLRSDGNRLNPGTTADLVTACLFIALRENRVTPAAPFRWDASDWL